MSDDTISRQAAIDFVGSMEMCDEISAEAYKKLTNYLEDLPSAERRGRWNIELDKNRLFYECKCSVCGHIESFDPKYRWFNYCPNCGTRLEGESE